MSAAGEGAVKPRKVHKLNPRRRKQMKQDAPAAVSPDEQARRQEQKRRRVRQEYPGGVAPLPMGQPCCKLKRAEVYVTYG